VEVLLYKFKFFFLLESVYRESRPDKPLSILNLG